MQNIRNSITVFTHFHLFLVCLIRLNEEAVCNYSNIASFHSVARVERVGELGLAASVQQRSRTAGRGSTQVSSGAERPVAPPMGGVFKNLSLDLNKNQFHCALCWPLGSWNEHRQRKSFGAFYLLRSGRARKKPFQLDSNIHCFHYKI